MNFTQWDVQAGNRLGRRASLNMPRKHNCRKMTKCRFKMLHGGYGIPKSALTADAPESAEAPAAEA